MLLLYTHSGIYQRNFTFPNVDNSTSVLIAWYKQELKKHPIEIRLNTEVKDISSLGDEFLDYVKEGMTVTLKEDGTVAVE